MNLVPGTPVGKYVVRRKLAEGGMAEIYLASFRGPEGFEKDVVIKRIRSFLASDPSFVEMFKGEARLASRLNHANIVQLFDFGKHEDTWYIAMEYVRGRSLWDLRKRSRELMTAVPPTLVAHIGSEVARGLHYAHKLKASGRPLGLVHRDVTPHNVLLSYEGAVKLTDFGIAKGGTKLTSPGVLKGKFAYMSPEQARGDEVDARTDVFALGIVLWEMLTGARLFVCDSDVATLRAVQHSVIVPPARLNPEVRPELDAVVMRALERDPENRFQTAQEMERALRQFVLRYAESVDETDAGGFLRRLFAAELTQDGVERTSAAIAVPAEPPPAPPTKGKVTVVMRVPRKPPAQAETADGSASTIAAPASPQTLTHLSPPTTIDRTFRRGRGMLAAGVMVLAAGAMTAIAVWVPVARSVQPDHPGAAAMISGHRTAEERTPGAEARSPAPPPGLAPGGEAVLLDPLAAFLELTPPATVSHAHAVEPIQRTDGGGSPEATPPALAEAGVPSTDLATLVVNVKPWANVFIAGENRGEVVGRREWDLPSGRYLVRFIHPKKQKETVVMLTRARRTTVRFDALAR